MLDRIRCLNPNCRRTAPAEKYPGSDYVICAKCWRSLPQRMRARHKQLNARSRKLFRLSRRTKFSDVVFAPQWERIERSYGDAWARLNGRMIKYFTDTEQPIGIEDFSRRTALPEKRTRSSGQRRRSAAYSRGFDDGMAFATSFAGDLRAIELLEAARALTSALAQTPEYSAAMARLRAAVENLQ